MEVEVETLKSALFTTTQEISNSKDDDPRDFFSPYFNSISLLQSMLHVKTWTDGTQECASCTKLMTSLMWISPRAKSLWHITNNKMKIWGLASDSNVQMQFTTPSHQQTHVWVLNSKVAQKCSKYIKRTVCSGIIFLQSPSTCYKSVLHQWMSWKLLSIHAKRRDFMASVSNT